MEPLIDVSLLRQGLLLVLGAVAVLVATIMLISAYRAQRY